MSVERSIDPDLQNAEVCSFLTDSAATEYSTADERKNEWVAEKYDYVAVKEGLIDDAADKTMTLAVFCSWDCEVFTQDNRLLNTFTITDLGHQLLEFQIGALLFVKQGLDAAKAQLIRDTFDKVVLATDDVAQVETALIRAGVDMDDYQVALFFHLTKINYVSDATNLKAFRQQVAAELDEDGKPLYRVEWQERPTFSCTQPDNVHDDDHVIIGDPDSPVDSIIDYERERVHECDDLVVTDHRIGTAFQYREWKTEMEMKTIRVGRCRLMKTKVPVVYHRTTKEVLIGYVISEGDLKRYMERAFRECLKSAAVTTAVLAIVTGGMGMTAAAAAFCSALQKCLEEKVTEVVVCLFSRLKLVTERGEWKHGV